MFQNWMNSKFDAILQHVSDSYSFIGFLNDSTKKYGKISFFLHHHWKLRFQFNWMKISALGMQSTDNMLQNETNPSSVAAFVWQWEPDREEGVIETLQISSNLAIFQYQTKITRKIKLRFCSSFFFNSINQLWQKEC